MKHITKPQKRRLAIGLLLVLLLVIVIFSCLKKSSEGQVIIPDNQKAQTIQTLTDTEGNIYLPLKAVVKAADFRLTQDRRKITVPSPNADNADNADSADNADKKQQTEKRQEYTLTLTPREKNLQQAANTVIIIYHLDADGGVLDINCRRSDQPLLLKILPLIYEKEIYFPADFYADALDLNVQLDENNNVLLHAKPLPQA